jgi:ABC-type transport system involved in multi-copper enzyme maturation permease subunit
MMTKTMLLFFWILWLLDVLAALYGYREFIGGVFGRYASANAKYILLWLSLLSAILLILGASLYFKNQERPMAALIVALIPLVLATPYILFLGAAMLGGKNRWN